MQISCFIPHFLKLCICYKTLCEILKFTVMSCCPQLGSVTLVTTGLSGTTWISRCHGVLAHSQLSTLQLPRFSFQLATPPSLCSILCQCAFLYLDISDAYDVSCAPLSWIFYPTAIQIHSQMPHYIICTATLIKHDASHGFQASVQHVPLHCKTSLSSCQSHCCHPCTTFSISCSSQC